MCIAIVKKKGASISDEALKNSFNNNPDGAGIAYTQDGKLYIVKGIFDEKQFIQEVRKAEKIADGAMLIHCRIGTSGLKDKNNCHPHIVNNNTVMIHNGILQVDVPKDSNVSDTMIYTKNVLSKLPENFIYNKVILKLVENDIGRTNKFAFLNDKGDYAIVNEEAGDWVDNVWYSNDTYSYSRILWEFSPRNKSYYNNYYEDWYDDDEPYVISKNKIKKLRKQIKNLSYEELMSMGEYPVYDITNGRLISEYETPQGQWLYLEEVNQDLYWDYVDRLELCGIQTA